MKQIPLGIGPELLPTFDTFLPGSNAAALEHLRHLRMPSAPVYLWGPGGSGKSHLLSALSQACREAGLRAGWLDAADKLPWDLQPDWALVVIDRCDQLDADAQQAAFALFVDAATQGVQVAAAGRVPPVDLPLREDLRTRLGWGHVFAMQVPTEPETRAILRRDADRRGMLLPDEVLDYLMTRFPRDLTHLIAVFDRLDEFSIVTSRALTVPLIRQMLAEEGPLPPADQQPFDPGAAHSDNAPPAEI